MYDTDYIVFYGTLMRNCKKQSALNVESMLKYITDCTIKGNLYDLGSYPGLTSGSHRVFGELYQITDFSVFQFLDVYEDYFENDLQKSLFIRKKIQLTEPQKQAWIYLYNGSLRKANLIRSQNWYTHKKIIY